MILRNECTYQTYPAKAVQYRRSPGLQAEYGYVDLDFKDFKKLVVVARDVPWRGIRGFEIDGQTDIRTFFLTASRATVTEPIELTPPKRGGFNQFGNLVLTTFDHARNRRKRPATVFKDIYVDSTGIEEIVAGLADIEKHDRGTVRIPLTDIRRYYPNYGAFYGRVNYRLRSGNWDPTSVKDGKSEPWTLQEVLVYLFSQLPGTPCLVTWSEIFKRGQMFESPNLVEGTGEPVVEVIHRLLERNGLTPMMQPNNSYAINLKNSSKFGHQQVPAGKGRVKKGGQRLQLHYERKSVTTTDRPPAVLVTGKKRIKRITLPYVPVLQDTNGGWYTIAEIANRWGYSLAKINAGIVNGHEKNFSDVPPSPGDEVVFAVQSTPEGQTEVQSEIIQTGGGRLHYQRKQILKQAYKFYAPAHLFQRKRDISRRVVGAVPGKLVIRRNTECAFIRSGVAGRPPVATPSAARITRNRGLVGLASFQALEGFGDADFTNLSFLPITECPWYVSELEKLNIEIPEDSTAKGDREDYVLMPPVVRAQRMGHQFFTNFFQVKKNFDAVTKQTREQLKQLRALRVATDERARLFAADVARSEIVLADTFSSAEARSKWFTDTGSDEIDVGADVQLAARFVGVELNTVIKQRMTEQSWSTLHAIVDMAEAIRDLDAKRVVLQKKLETWKAQFEVFEVAHSFGNGFKLRYNLPQMALDDGIVRVDPETGILKSTEPLMHVDKPIFFDGDESTVVDDGQVIVTFGYELQDPNINAWTTFLFVPSNTADNEPATPILAGFARSSPIKAFVQPYNGRMYMMDAGTPVNLHETYTQARQKAAALLSVPRVLTGFTYEYSGFHDFPLDAGVSGVQWIWNGAAAHTHLSINAPNARMPLGPNRLADMEPRRGPGRTVSLDRRDELEREAD